MFKREDYVPSYSEPFEQIRDELVLVSERLLELLPDPSLGPDERLERLARVVPKSTLISANHRTARSKLTSLRHRLRELVPDPDLTAIERLESLVARVHELVPGDESRLITKLERLGDRRGSDIGR